MTCMGITFDPEIWLDSSISKAHKKKSKQLFIFNLIRDLKKLLNKKNNLLLFNVCVSNFSRPPRTKREQKIDVFYFQELK